MGATAPEAYGDYYAWREITARLDYSDETYVYGTENNIGKHNVTDGLTVSESECDVASVI